MNEQGDAERQVMVYPNGLVRTYDREHPENEHGALAIMVVDGDEAWWQPFAITREEFEEVWRVHGGAARV